MTTSTEAIERQSSTPYYQQLFTTLERRLRTGQMAPGERLPSENELCTEFGLSRATVRQALQLLETRGLVHRVAGRGVFVAEPTTGAASAGWTIQDPEGFLENAIGHQNRAVTTQVLRHGRAELPAHACRALQVPEGSRGFELVRLRSLDGTPAVYSVNYSPPSLITTMERATGVLAGQASLSEYLARSGYPLGGAHRLVRAVAPDGDIAKALQVRRTTPILHIRSSSWTPDDVRYDVYDTYVRSDVVPLEVTVSTVERPDQ